MAFFLHIPTDRGGRLALPLGFSASNFLRKLPDRKPIYRTEPPSTGKYNTVGLYRTVQVQVGKPSPGADWNEKGASP